MQLRSAMQDHTYLCPECEEPVFKPGSVIYTPDEMNDCHCQQCGRAYTAEDVINQARKAAADLLHNALHRQR